MDVERYQVVRVDGHGLGVIISQSAYYATVQFNHDGHLWRLAVAHDDYDLADEVNIGYEEIQ
jgi:hypothetical protein